LKKAPQPRKGLNHQDLGVRPLSGSGGKEGASSVGFTHGYSHFSPSGKRFRQLVMMFGQLVMMFGQLVMMFGQLVMMNDEFKVRVTNEWKRVKTLDRGIKSRFLLLVHHSPIVIHHSPIVIHHSPIVIHHSPIVIHHSPIVIHHSPIVIHHSQIVIHHSSFIIRHPSFLGWLARALWPRLPSPRLCIRLTCRTGG
jgi:hypothetical protein